MSGFTLGPDTLAATPTAGQVEYNGTAMYYTPSGVQRGIIPGMQLFVLNTNLAGLNATGAQNYLGVGVTLAGSTVYQFECVFATAKTTGTTSHNFQNGFGGTATLNNIAYFFSRATSAISLTDVSAYQELGGYAQTASPTSFITGSTSATTYSTFILKGTVSINASGTFIPQYSLSTAPGGAYTILSGSYMSIYPIGTAGSNVSIGTWA